MSEPARKPPESLQDSLRQVERLLTKHRLVDAALNLAGQADAEAVPVDPVDSLVHEQSLTELRKKLDRLHPVDIAHILEALPPAERHIVWEQVSGDERNADILLEVSDAVRETLIADMDREELLAATEHLDTDELADLAPDLPSEVVQEVIGSLDAEEREDLKAALSYADDEVGSLMSFEMATIREDVTLEVVLRYLRRFDELPDHTDKLFVITKDDEVLRGVLPLERLLINDPDTVVAELMITDLVTFKPQDDVYEAAQAFERYDLVSAPVVDDAGQLVGRLTVDTMVDVIREEADSEVLNLAGLREEEDLFASVLKSAKNRWPWLGVNLLTAFMASRVIGAFESTIAQLVALAALMPIISGIGGNTGTQTATLIIRGLAMDQISYASTGKLIRKELAIAVLNGLFWGAVIGLITFALYRRLDLGLVMALAMLLNLLVAALAGLFIPMSMQKLGRDPAYGSSVLLTFTTDSMGFFIFLGLASLLLL
ncbi:MAG: magnesium transporter [Gammaproteobacteria bacterium]|nr:magnesium transporter [Gammaproteobacteria bacterium]